MSCQSGGVTKNLWPVSKSMRASVIFLFALSIAMTTQGQQQTIVDSLVQCLSKVKNDTIKARLYKSIVEQYSSNNPDEAFRFATEGMSHVEAMKWSKGIAVFHSRIGVLYNDKGDYTKAVDHFEKAYSTFASSKDYFNAASVLNNWGAAYQHQSVYDKATEKFFEALKLAEDIPNNYLIAICLGNISKIYSAQSDYQKGLDYAFKALELQRSDSNKNGIAETYIAIADTYMEKKDTVLAKQYYEDALAGFIETGNSLGIASAYTNMSLLFRDTKNALDYRLKAQEIWDKVSPAHTMSIVNLGNIAYAYIDMVRHPAHYPDKISRNELLEKAETCINRAVLYSLESENKNNYAFLIGARSELEAEKGNFKKAYSDVTLYHRLNDSIFSQESKNKIANIEGHREVVLRDKEIELNQLALTVERKQNLGLTLGLGLVLTIGALLYRQNQIRKKTNAALLRINSQLDEANKVKAKFFAILSHDLRSPLARLINFLHLQIEAPDLLRSEQAAIHQKKIITSAEALLGNMETVLLWGKGQMVHFKPVKSRIPVGTLFKQLDEAFKGYEKVHLTFLDQEKIEISTDENYLITIMQNLTANAIKALYGNTKGAITWKAEKGSDDKIILSITDNGPGLDEHQIEKLFAGQEITGSKNGFGFHIVRDLAKSVECRIAVISKPKTGTTFQLHF
jgi:signal transduction histidine kinase/tetratricopeptide (TPR) repeat protein